MNIFLGITGASGFIYAEKLIYELMKIDNLFLYLSATEGALSNLIIEKRVHYDNFQQYIESLDLKRVKFYYDNDYDSPVASGSFLVDYYLVVPASMGFIGRLANGISSNLIERALDVGLKEGRGCLLLFREMPLNQIHLENLLKLSRVGVKILPASPGFYHQPNTIDDLVNFVVGKVMDNLGLSNNLFKRWL
jgi:4-hydroxy-3-polyprenylbenzoate decarboxylase